jgi:endonuclease/exonuclease/phosphatase family metal-dependent hydrolase
LNLSLLYVPSMRNGSVPLPGRAATDRGNAILSTFRLSEPEAIELPAARQRRVAVAARMVIHTPCGDLPISVVSVHLDVLGSARTLWLFGASSARGREARFLIGTLPDRPMIVGADLNSWQGLGEPAVRAFFRAFASTPGTGSGSTFRGGLVLDYLFFRLPDGWRAHLTRVAARYGSDHYPVAGRLIPARSCISTEQP